jgi:AraC family transcriptional regulator
MPLPDTTSAEAFQQYVGGSSLLSGRGAAWRDIKAWVVGIPSSVDAIHTPSVNEPFLAWTLSGEADFQEREKGRPWVSHRIRKGSFFLTSGGDPYDCRWTSVSPEPMQTMLVFIGLSVLQRAFEEVFGDRAPQARLADVSAFTDPVLSSLMERVHDELKRKEASPLLLQGVAQTIAIHLARTYADTVGKRRSRSSALPGYKLRQLTDWMTEHFDEEFSLDELAAKTSLSKFHFHRLFKAATGVSPSRYHLDLRMNAARRILRETKHSVISVALEVGYTNPSHFAQLFRRETGLSPSDYRRKL